MRQVIIILLLHWLLIFVEAEVMESNKVLEDEPNSEEYERRHRRRRPNNGAGLGTGYTGPCGFGGYGRTFGDKLFGNPGYSYIVAPVNNYYYTCGVQPVPLPIPAPVPVIQPHPTPGFGHHHNHGFGNPGVSVGSASFAGPGVPVAPFRPNYNYNQQYNRPFNNVVSAAASGFGNALADYLSGGSRPRRIYKQFNKPNNQRVDVENSTADDTLLPEQPQPRVLHLMTLTETILHLMNTNIGSGLLAMGDAFKNGGLVFATLMTVFLGFICVHAQHQLLNCSTKMQKTRKMQELPNFAETVKQCFETGPVKIRWLATYLSYLVNIFIFVSQVGCSCVYIVFTANNLENVLDQYDLYCGGLRVNMMLITFIIMIICAIDSFKVMTHVSTCSLLLFVFGLGAVLYEAVQDLPPVSDRNYLAGWQQLPLYLGTAVYAFDAIGLVLPLKNEMKNPDIFQKRFGVLNISMTVLGSIFIAVGFLGYLKWGEDVQGSVTLNLQNKILSQVVQGVISVGILLTYPVQLYVPVKTIWPVVHEQWSIAKRRPLLVELMLKMLLILFTLLLAEVVPYLELVISLLGAVTATFLALILPPILETITEENCRWWLLFKNIFMVLLGLLIFLTGTYQSMCAIVEAFAM